MTDLTPAQHIGRMAACLALGPGVPDNFWPTGFNATNGAMQNPVRRILEPLMLWVSSVPLGGRKLAPQPRAALQRAEVVLEEGAGVELRRLSLEEETEAMMAFYRERAVILLRAARLTGGLTQVQAAAVCGVAPRTYEAWERDEARIPSGAQELLEARVGGLRTLN